MDVCSHSENINGTIALHTNEPMIETKNGLDKPKKKKKPRCPVCNKKLGLLPYTCKCGLDFCVGHIQPELHNCTYDHKSDGKDSLSEKLVKVVASKVEKI